MLISKARQGLNLEVDPVIATAFVLLQKFFRDNECSYELIILMTAALFTSCKQAESFRSMFAIYKELFRICQSAPSKMVRSVLGERHWSGTMDASDVGLVTQVELELIDAAGYDFCIELPFMYSDRVAELLAQVVPEDKFRRCQSQMAVDICLALCSEVYLDIPPEVTAAAATADTLSREVVPAPIVNWMTYVIDKYGMSVFNLAKCSIAAEKRKTLPRDARNCM